MERMGTDATNVDLVASVLVLPSSASTRRKFELGFLLVLREREIGTEVRTALRYETFDQVRPAQLD